jgi:fatty acid CoA ligase FadD9
MSTSMRDRHLQRRRIQGLYTTDPQFADARPDNEITVAITRPGLRLAQIAAIVMEGYADRPALGQRAVQFINDAGTGRTVAELLPRFDTITYRELWDRAGAAAAVMANKPVRPGDRVCLLGFNGVDYAVTDLALIRLGAVSVPLPTSTPVAQLRRVVAETKPSVIASSIDSLAQAVELALTVHTPTRLVVFDYHPEVDDEREAFDAAKSQLVQARSIMIMEPLADVLARGKRVPVESPVVPDEKDPLKLLIYASGSTGAPKGAMYPEHLVANFWRRSRGSVSPASAPSITLNFVPMSHALGQHILHGALGSGGTAYFVAKSDFSTLLDDLALVRPTDLNFVPRVWEMLFAEFQSQLDRRATDGADRATGEVEIVSELRGKLVGGRYVSAMTSSAPISAELTAWVESFLDMHLVESYGSTEAGPILVDGRVRRPPVTDLKLADVPDLGYFHTDRPHPRGELLVKSDELFAGYYERPEVTAGEFDQDGYYRTGDLVAEMGPGQFVYLDRRNDVLKPSQGDYVAVPRLEPVFGDSSRVDQVTVRPETA